MLETEWPARKAAFERWLGPENFDADGTQKKKLGEFHEGNAQGGLAQAQSADPGRGLAG
jgi:hypothetical protein